MTTKELSSPSPIIILEAEDIVFSKIGARLDFHNNKRFFSLVGKAMNGAGWNKTRLIFMEALMVVVDGNGCCPLQDDPMLGPVLMALKRGLMVRMNLNTLDLYGFIAVEDFIFPPGALFD